MEADDRSNYLTLHAAQERKRIQNVSQEEHSNHRNVHAFQQRQRLQNMNSADHSNKRINRTLQERDRIVRLTGNDRIMLNERNVTNQRNSRHNQATQSNDVEYEQYLASFDSNDKIPLESYPYIKKLQDKFWKDVSKYEQRQCNVCQERWPAHINLHHPLREYTCIQCSRETEEVKRFSRENDMIPLTLIS